MTYLDQKGFHPMHACYISSLKLRVKILWVIKRGSKCMTIL